MFCLPRQADRCATAFYSQPCESLAKALLGCTLVRETSPTLRLTATIVETEAYLGGEDKAAHSYNGKRTPRNEAMYMDPGTCYVYSVYGTHSCVNVSSLGEGAAVLIRALEPVTGVENMYTRRKSAKKDKDLCNGPAKLCQALDIDKTLNKVDLTSCACLWVEPRSHDLADDDIVCTGRVGVNYAGTEWSNKHLRFYVKGNRCVSRL